MMKNWKVGKNFARYSVMKRATLGALFLHVQRQRYGHLRSNLKSSSRIYLMRK